MQATPATIYYYTESPCAELVLTGNGAREFPWHTHARHWVVGLVCSGAAVCVTRHEKQSLARGDFFVVPPNLAHCLSLSSDSVLAVLCWDAGQGLEESLHNLAGSLRCLENERSVAALCGFEKLRDLALRLAKERCFEVAALPLTPAVQAVAERLREFPAEPFSLDEMAALAGYSRWHFLRLFQREVGLTPHAYHMVCRLGILRSLLRSGTAAAEAAVSAGFSDQSHMHKVFKLHHGLTPKAFKAASAMHKSR